MRNKDRTTLFPAVVAFGIYLLWLILNGIWLWQDPHPPLWETAFHASTTLDIAQALASGSWSEGWSVLMQSSSTYPPLTYLLCAPFAWFYPHADMLVFSMDLLFGALLCVSLWKIGCLLGARWAGVGAILLTLYQVRTVIPSHYFWLDLPLAAMVICAYWRVLVCNKAWTPRNGMILGLVMGLGLLTKWSFPLYMAPAIVWLAWRRPSSGMKTDNWRILAWMACIAIVVAGWWYLLKWSDIVQFFGFQAGVAARPDSVTQLPIWSPAKWLFYLALYWKTSAVPCGLWILTSCMILWRGPRNARTLTFWILSVYLILTLVPNKDPRYLLPLVASIALTTWWAVLAIRHSWTRRGIAVLLALWCLAQMTVLSFEKTGQALAGKLRGQVFGITLNVFARKGAIFAPLLKDEVLVERVFDSIISYGDNRPTHVLVLVMEKDLNWMTFGYEIRRRGLDSDHFRFTGTYTARTEDQLNAIWNDTYDVVVAYDIAYLSKAEEQPPSSRLYGKHNIRRLTHALIDASDRYHMIDEFQITSGKKIKLYIHQTGLVPTA